MPKHNIGSALAPSAQKYHTVDPYPNVPFAVDEEPVDKVSWVIGIVAIAMLIVGVILP